MIKALSIMELFQVIKRYIRQSGLNFQKCYERDQNMRAEDRVLRPETGGWINLIALKVLGYPTWFINFKLHVTRRQGEVHPGVRFFWDTRNFHLGLKTENFHPGVKSIFWPLCMIFKCFHFIKIHIFWWVIL